MAIDTKVGSFTAATSTGNQAVTGVGFQPKAILIMVTEKATSDGTAADWSHTRGMATSASKQFCFSVSAEDATGGHTKAVAANLIHIIENTTIVMEAAFVSFDSDGFTINWTTNDGTARIINYTVLGGAELTAEVGSDTAKATTGTKSVTTTFQPDCVVLIGTASGTIPQLDLSSNLSFGVAADASTEIALGTNLAGGQASTLQRTDRCLVATTGPSTTKYAAQFDSKTSTSFTLDWLTTSGDTNFGWMALKGLMLSIGSFTAPTSTGALNVTTTGILPSATILFGFNAAAQTTLKTGGILCIGAADSSLNEFVNAISTDEGGGSNLFKDQSLKRTACYQQMTSADGIEAVITTEADITAFSNNKFILNFSVVDAVAREVLFFAMGGPTVAIPDVTTETVQTNRGFTYIVSDVQTIDGNIIIQKSDTTQPHCFVGLQFYSDDTGLEASRVIPTAGTMTLTISTINNEGTFETITGGTMDITAPVTLNWAANTKRVKAVPLGVTGATHYRVIVTCNLT